MSLVLAENFLKSSPKCLLACVSGGTHGKIHNRDFFRLKTVKNADDPFALPSHDPNHYVNGETTFHFVLVLRLMTDNFNFCH